MTETNLVPFSVLFGQCEENSETRNKRTTKPLIVFKRNLQNICSTVFAEKSWGTRERLLGKFCGRQGNEEPLLLESNSLMRVRFSSDGSVNRTGFSASYQTGTSVLHWPVIAHPCSRVFLSPPPPPGTL